MTDSDRAAELRERAEAERRAGRIDAAIALYEESIALFRGTNDPVRLAHTIRHLADIHRRRSDAAAAEPLYVEALNIYRSSADARVLDVANAIRGYALLKERADLWQEALDLYTEADVAAGVAESRKKLLQCLEPIFHRPELGTTRTDFERMTEPSFWEVSASGRIYSRDFVLNELEKRYAGEYEDEWSVRDFDHMVIAPDNYLVTYTLIQGTRVTRRATIWRRTSDGWKAVYHQGTIVSEAQ